jgi:hypothetical protein
MAEDEIRFQHLKLGSETLFGMDSAGLLAISDDHRLRDQSQTTYLRPRCPTSCTYSNLLDRMLSSRVGSDAPMINPLLLNHTSLCRFFECFAIILDRSHSMGVDSSGTSSKICRRFFYGFRV